jgi:hypothetical protein
MRMPAAATALVSALVAFGSWTGLQRATAQSAPVAACGGCHLLPPAEVLPRAAWADSVLRMQRIRDGSEATATPATSLPADFVEALRWYESRAPVALASPADWPAAQVTRFVLRGLAPPAAPPTPVISDVQLVDVDRDARLELVASDMRHGLVLIGRPYDPADGLTLAGRIPHPSRVSVADLDRDGVRDLLVGDLGEFLPRDHDKGAVVWLRGLGQGRFAPFAIGGLPRVASVEAADLDGDGDLDLLVAAFGYRRTGSVLILENRTTDWTRPAFSPITLDPRPGAVRAMATDLNDDGNVDVVALVSQEHEEVVAYVRGEGLSFSPAMLWKAPHANWGSSGLALADLDGDRDEDLIVANGDTFDDSLLKPYHGVGWLERTGRAFSASSFTYRRLADLPGPHNVAAADLDGDGDLDVVASALVAGGGGTADERLPAVVWLEQTARRRFERRTLKMGAPRHAALAAGDYDGDGDVDLVTGNMATTGPIAAWVELWERQSPRRKGTKTHGEKR